MRYRLSRPPKPRVIGSRFEPIDLNVMEKALINLFERCHSALSIVLTNEEISRVFTPYEFREENAKVAKRINMMHFTNSTFKVQWRGGKELVVALNYPYDVLIPSKPEFQWDAENREILNRIDEWIKHREQIGLEFGQAIAMVSYLVDKHTIREILYLFPSVLILLRLGNSEIVKGLSDYKRKPVSVEHALQDIIGRAATTIAGALMMPAAREAPTNIDLIKDRTQVPCSFAGIGSFYTR